MSLGENIKKARTDKKMTQQDLADKISDEENTYINTSISNWENNINKPDADTIAALCRVLDVDANFLLDFDTLKNEKQNNLTQEELEDETFFSKYKMLSIEDKELFKNLMETRKKQIDKEKGEE